ncbi:MAG: acyl-CoA thioesterase [Bacteroidaceae bacterium]|nr:acyl-CoA thioesterase [Bacteroidaceae bacterium]
MPAQLRFSDVDRFGHVNNSVYFALFDMCKTKYFLDVIGPSVFDRLAIVIANVNADFLAPIYYPDEIVIQTSVIGMGNKSFTLFQRALNVRTQEVKCECQTIMVVFDTEESRSARMPDEWKEKIIAYEQNGCLTRAEK